MKYYELAYTQPYLMTLHPDSEMDVAFLGRPQMTRAFIEYGDTPALGRSVEAERFVINGNRIGEVTQRLYDEITGIQWGKMSDPFGWTVPVE